MFREAISEFRYNRYINIKTALVNAIQCQKTWTRITARDIKGVRRSDTLFILGSGPSLNLIGKKELDAVRCHDVLGISLSFLFEDIIPTYHFFPLERESENDHGRSTMVRLFQVYKESYDEVIMLCPYKAQYRLGHPCFLPNVFPPNPKIHYLRQREKPKYNADEGFTDAYFDQSLIYRGTLTVVLEFAYTQGYKNIVLLGVDPLRFMYFFQDYPIMQKYLEELYLNYFGCHAGSGSTKPYVNMQTRPGSEGSILEYLSELRPYLMKYHGISLKTGFRDSELSPYLDHYF